MVLLQTIAIVILVYYLLKLLFRWLGPKLLRYAMKKTSERFGGAFQGPQGFGGPAPGEGETTLEKRNIRRSNPSKKVGEYIDFEEID